MGATATTVAERRGFGVAANSSCWLDEDRRDADDAVSRRFTRVVEVLFLSAITASRTRSICHSVAPPSSSPRPPPPPLGSVKREAPPPSIAVVEEEEDGSADSAAVVVVDAALLLSGGGGGGVDTGASLSIKR